MKENDPKKQDVILENTVQCLCNPTDEDFHTLWSVFADRLWHNLGCLS